MTHFNIRDCMDHRHANVNLSETNPWMGIFPVRKSKLSPSRLTIHFALSLKWVILINNSVVMIFIDQYDLFFDKYLLVSIEHGNRLVYVCGLDRSINDLASPC